MQNNKKISNGVKKNFKILIIGFGSIGQRHYRNLESLGFKNLHVYDPYNKKADIKILNKKTLDNFDVAFVCNPNNLHIKTAIKCAQAGLHLFIEKPLSHDLKDLGKLENLIKKNKLIDMVACNMRFHPGPSFIKKYLEKNSLGKIYNIHHEFGYYLPYWRPGADYRKNYAARKSTGGGIILDDIHEFDLLFWFNNFSRVKQAKFIFDKLSDLKIATEDNCLASFNFVNGVIGSVRCDYLQQQYSRTCKIVGEKGNLEWDFNENIVWLKTKGKNKKLFEKKKYDLNIMYINEIKYFFKLLDKKEKSFNSVKTAMEVLKYCVNRK